MPPIPGRPSLQLDLPSTTTAPRLARRAIRSALSGAPGEVDAIELVVSELVTNAVLHGRPPVSLRLAAADDGTHLEVCDGSPAAPARRQPSATGGRGLHILDAYATRWGTRPLGRGKCVWARF